MSLLDWFRPTWQSLSQRAEKALAAQNFAKSIRLFEKALTLAIKEQDAIRNQISSRLLEAKKLSARAILQEAQRAASAHKFIEARDLAQLVFERAPSQEIQREAATLIERLTEDEDLDPELAESDQNVLFEAHIAQAPKTFHKDYERLRDELIKSLFGGRPSDELVEREPVARYERALLYSEEGNISAAISDLELLQPRLMGEGGFHQKLAELYLQRSFPEGFDPIELPELSPQQQSDLTSAKQHLNLAIAGDPINGHLYSKLIETHLLLKELPQAKNTAQLALAQIDHKPTRSEILVCLYAVYLSEEDHTQAELALEEATESWSLSYQTEYLWNLSATLKLIRYWTRSDEKLEKALALAQERTPHPESEHYWWFVYYTGFILMRQGKREEALLFLRRARDLLPPESELQEAVSEAMAYVSEVTSAPYRTRAPHPKHLPK